MFATNFSMNFQHENSVTVHMVCSAYYCTYTGRLAHRHDFLSRVGAICLSYTTKLLIITRGITLRSIVNLQLSEHLSI